MLVLAALLIAGCDQSQDRADSTAPSSDSHEEAVAKFQQGQQRFKKLIATVRDEKSFDVAKPELDKVVSDWREAAASLGKLAPPPEEQQARFRALIAEGHRATEPTGEDMLSLISIESRDEEVTRWLEKFAAAAGAAGTEMTRLYGQVDYAGPEMKSPELDLRSSSINGVPYEEVMKDPAAALMKATEAEQAGAGQPATRSKSDPEAGDKPQPEAEGRSR